MVLIIFWKTDGSLSVPSTSDQTPCARRVNEQTLLKSAGHCDPGMRVHTFKMSSNQAPKSTLCPRITRVLHYLGAHPRTCPSHWCTTTVWATHLRLRSRTIGALARGIFCNFHFWMTSVCALRRRSNLFPTCGKRLLNFRHQVPNRASNGILRKHQPTVYCKCV